MAQAEYNGGMIYEFQNESFVWEGLTIRPVRVSDEYISAAIPMHRHSSDSFELHVVFSGEGRVRTEQAEYALSAGNVYLTAGSAEHEQSALPQAPVRELCLYATAERLRGESAAAKRFLSRPFSFGKADAEFLALAETIAEELTRRLPGYRSAAAGAIMRLLSLFVRMEEAGAAPSEREEPPSPSELYLRIEEAFLYGYREITLQSLSRRIGLSPRQTQRVLKERYGATFSQKKTQARMSAANVLLQRGMSVTQVSEEVGYSCVEHFSAEYRKYFSFTASEYKKRTRTP